MRSEPLKREGALLLRPTTLYGDERGFSECEKYVLGLTLQPTAA